ncbi:MAG: hypothetical protein GX567_00670 [Clostridia bacterium]|nr:hypothetical protein [Clostridia bacterium]
MAKKNNKNDNITRIKDRRPINLNLGIIMFAIIFIYMAASIILYLKKEPITPYEVKNGTLAENNIYKGIILREEEIVPASDSGYINYYAKENEKVANGSMVYTIDETGKLAELAAGRAGDGSSLSDNELSELKTSISEFATGFAPKEYDSTYSFKDEVEGTVLKLANYKILSEIDTLSGNNLADAVNFGYAPESGIIVYATDGFEDMTAEQLTKEMFDPENYKKEQKHSNDLISKDEPAYKLITSEDWSVVLPIDEERAATFENEPYLQVRFLKNDYTSWGQVSLIRKEDQVLLKLDFSNSMISFASERMLELELMTNTTQGLKIPNSSIVEREFYLIPVQYLTKGGNSDKDGFIREIYLEDGTASTEFVEATIYNKTDEDYYVDVSIFNVGDYIVMPESTEKYAISKKATLIGVYNINKGYADFKQITILNQNEEYAIVKSNAEYGLSVYDHIVLDGTSVNEDDFIYN